MRVERGYLLFITGVSVLIGLNFVVLLSAYSSSIAQLCCTFPPAARDFSAYYEGLWRLLHDPSQIYTQGFLNVGPTFSGAEQYKYMPSFLLMISPLSVLGYQQAIIAFDTFQFALLVPISWLVYMLVKDKGMAATLLVAAVVLLLPIPAPGWSLSVPYFWLWKEGRPRSSRPSCSCAPSTTGRQAVPDSQGCSWRSRSSIRGSASSPCRFS